MSTYRILHNAKIKAPARDVEIFMAHFFRQPKYRFVVHREPTSGPQFIYFRNDEFGDAWGGAQIVEWSNGTTQIVEMFEFNNIYYSGDPKIFEEFSKMHFEWLEELSDAIRKTFKVKEKVKLAKSQSVVDEAAKLEELDWKDKKILECVRKDFSITDKELAQKLGIRRQAVNVRRRSLEKAGYKVRVSRQNK